MYDNYTKTTLTPEEQKATYEAAANECERLFTEHRKEQE